MGLTAFVVFVVPWMFFAVWLSRSPSAIRLGAPSAPWRQLTPGRNWLQEQDRRETIRRNAVAYAGSGPTGGNAHGSAPMRDGGTLGSSVEDVESKD
jgi:hypothetical protein